MNDNFQISRSQLPEGMDGRADGRFPVFSAFSELIAKGSAGSEAEVETDPLPPDMLFSHGERFAVLTDST